MDCSWTVHGDHTYTHDHYLNVQTIWSGIFSIFLLGRTLLPHKWVGLIMLSGGIAAVQVRPQGRSC